MTFYQRQQVIIEEAKNKIFKVLFQKHGDGDRSFYEVALDFLRDNDYWVHCSYNGEIHARRPEPDGTYTYPDLTNEQIIVLGDMMDDIDTNITKHINEGTPLYEFYPKIRLVGYGTPNPL